MTRNYDAIIIGTGQSGPALAARLHKEGQKTAIIERKLVGGTCVNVGCTPTKTLVGSARIAYLARQARAFGISIDGDIAVDMGRVKARKDAIAGASNQGVTEWLDGMDNVDLIRATPGSLPRIRSRSTVLYSRQTGSSSTWAPAPAYPTGLASTTYRISPTRASWMSTSCQST